MPVQLSVEGFCKGTQFVDFADNQMKGDRGTKQNLFASNSDKVLKVASPPVGHSLIFSPEVQMYVIAAATVGLAKYL